MSGRTSVSLYNNIVRDLLKMDEGTGDLEWRASRGNLYVRSKELEIRCVGCDTENATERIRGMTSAGWLADEVTQHTRSFVDMAISRCTAGGISRPKFWSCNPDHPTHYIKTQFIDSTELDVRNFYFTFEDNPQLTPDLVDELKRTFTGVFYDRMIRGLWTVAEGAVFDKFSRATHIVREFPLKTLQKYVLGVDWGYSTGHNLALLLIAVEDDGTCYVIDELVREQQLVDRSLVSQIEARGWFRLPLFRWNGLTWTKWEVKPETAFCDSARPEYLRLFKDLTGISTVGAIKTSKTEMIQAVQRRFIPDPRGKCGIYFLDGRTPHTLQEIDSYRWKPGTTDEPIKENDDCVDALQYAISMLHRGKVRVLKESPISRMFRGFNV